MRYESWESLSFPIISTKLGGWQQAKIDTVWSPITWVDLLTVVCLIDCPKDAFHK